MVVSGNERQGLEAEMTDAERPERRQANPWVIGIGSSIAAGIVILILPTIGGHLLDLSGRVWHGSIDIA